MRFTGLLWLALAAGTAVLAACRVSESTPAEARRIVPLGASVAETVFALGAGPEVVAVDASATYPAEVEALPGVGYVRALSSEGLLSVQPTLVLADTTVGPPAALEQVAAAGVPVEIVPDGQTEERVAAQIRAIAARLGREAAGQVLVDTLYAQVRRAEALRAQLAGAPLRVLYVQGQGGGALGIAGRGTSADAFIQMAGAVNAFGSVEGYRPMTAEAVVQADPDVIVLLERTAEVSGGLAALLARPELALTRAARQGRTVVLPSAALNFGPRLGASVLAFQQDLLGL